MWLTGGTLGLWASYDGFNWKSVTHPVGWILSIAWNGRMWLIGGSINPSMAYSYDGITWTGITGLNGYEIWKIVWNGLLWVAGGRNASTGMLAYSSDGTSWTISSGGSFLNTNTGVLSLTWNGSIWMAGGYGTTTTMVYSSDGITWFPLRTLNTLVGAGSLLVLSSRIVLPLTGTNLIATSTSWATYTPTWTGSSSNPAIGNGTIVGRFTIVGKTVNVYVKITMGSTTTYGAGTWRITLPFTAYASAILPTTFILASSRFQGLSYTEFAANTTYVTPVVSPGSGVTSTIPGTWGSGHTLSFSGSYESV
jgi:hypothetical protein